MTELTWKGKYDEKGNVKPVDRTILPFQVVETVNEPNATRAHTRSSNPAENGTWQRKLITRG